MVERTMGLSCRGVLTMAPTEEDLGERRDALVAAFRAGDHIACKALLDSGAIWVPPGTPPLFGRERIAEWLSAAFARYSYDLRLEPTELVTGARSARELGAFVSDVVDRRTQERSAHRGSYLLVWASAADDWTVACYAQLGAGRSALATGGPTP